MLILDRNLYHTYVQHEDFTELYTGLIGVHPSYRDTVGEVVFM